MFSRFTFEQIQWIFPVTEKSLSEQCEGSLKCYATENHEQKSNEHKFINFCDSRKNA